MKERFGLNQRLSLEEIKDPHSGMVTTGGRREAPTGEMNIVEKNGHITGPTTTTKMNSEGKDISLTKPKIFEGQMDTPIEEALEGILTMIGMNIPEA